MNLIIGLLITVAILAVLRTAVRDVFRRLMDGVDPALVEAAARARQAGDAAALTEVRHLYDRAGVATKATRIAAKQRLLAGEVVAACGMPRLREVLEFLLDLAVPAGATGG